MCFNNSCATLSYYYIFQIVQIKEAITLSLRYGSERKQENKLGGVQFRHKNFLIRQETETLNLKQQKPQHMRNTALHIRDRRTK